MSEHIWYFWVIYLPLDLQALKYLCSFAQTVAYDHRRCDLLAKAISLPFTARLMERITGLTSFITKYSTAP